MPVLLSQNMVHPYLSCKGTATPHAQRTKRLTTSIRHVGGEVSSEPAARLLSRLGILVRSATLLRLVKRAPQEPLSVPEALGVDEFRCDTKSRMCSCKTMLCFIKSFDVKEFWL